MNKAELRQHYRESEYLTPAGYDEPTVFAEVPESELRVFWDKLAARVDVLTQPLFSEICLVLWDAATELDRRYPG